MIEKVLSPCYRCPRCTEQGWPEYFGSEPKCGWNEDGSFNKDNWQCATLTALRWLAHKRQTGIFGMDETCYVVALLNWDTGPTGFVVLWSYKERGRVSGMAHIKDSASVPKPLTLAVAEEALK